MRGASIYQQRPARWGWAVWALPLVLGLALVAGSGERGGQATAQETRAALPADLARIQPASLLIASANLEAIWNSDAAKGVHEHALRTFGEQLQELEKELGVGLLDIQRITMVMPGIQPNGEPVFIIATKKA